MAKKNNFAAGFDRAMGKTEETAAETTAAATPVKAEKKAQPPVFSFRIDPAVADKIKDYAYTKRISIKEAVETMVEAFIDDYNADPENEPLLPHKR